LSPIKALGPGKTIVTVLADGGQRHQCMLFQSGLPGKRSLPVPPWMKRAQHEATADIADVIRRHVVSITPQRCSAA